MVENLFIRRMEDKQEREVEQTATIVIEEMDSVVVQPHLQTLIRHEEGGTEVATEDELRMKQEVGLPISQKLIDVLTSHQVNNLYPHLGLTPRSHHRHRLLHLILGHSTHLTSSNNNSRLTSTTRLAIISSLLHRINISLLLKMAVTTKDSRHKIRDRAKVLRMQHTVNGFHRLMVVLSQQTIQAAMSHLVKAIM